MDKSPITLGELLAAAEGRWTTFPGFQGSDKFTFFFSTVTARKKFLDAFKGTVISIPGQPSGKLLHKSSWKDQGVFWLSMTVGADKAVFTMDSPAEYVLRDYTRAREEIISMCDAPFGYSILYLSTRLIAKGLVDYDEDKVQILVNALVAEGILERNPGSPELYRKLKTRDEVLRPYNEAREEILRYLTGMPYGWGWIVIKRHLTYKHIKITERQVKELLDALVSEGVLELHPSARDKVYRHKDLKTRGDYNTRRRYNN